MLHYLLMPLNVTDLTLSSSCVHEEMRRYLKISDVGEEEADEGEGQTPFRHRADNMSCVALKNRTTYNTKY